MQFRGLVNIIFIMEMVRNLYKIYEPTLGYYFILAYMGSLAANMVQWLLSLQIVLCFEFICGNI